MSCQDRRPYLSLQTHSQILIPAVQEKNFIGFPCFINLLSTYMIATHDRLFRKCHSCIQYKSACAAVYYLFIYLFYANYTKPTISPEHNVFGICDRPMCLTISLISAGKLPGCSVWALCPCLDLHAVMFSSFKHLCDTALFLASLAYLQETGMVFEGEKNTHS